jgi:hypothetical protein
MSTGGRAHRWEPVVEGLERICLLAIPTTALTLTVNSADDTDGGFDQNGNPAGFFSSNELDLRTAITCVVQQANFLASQGLPQVRDTIAFNIVPGQTFGSAGSALGTYTNSATGPFILKPGTNVSSPYSPVPAAVTIDARTQPGYSAGHPAVYIDGSLLSSSGISGLEIDGGQSTIAGLGFIHFNKAATLDALRLSAAGSLTGNGGSDVVVGNTFGIDPSGAAAGNATDVFVATANNRIGGSAAADRNIVSSDGSGSGVVLAGSTSTSNLVEGNFIGTDVTGTHAKGTDGTSLGNGVGVLIEQGASANTVGGSTSGTGNLISNNTGNGVLITDAGTNNNVVQGNLIGTDATGLVPLGNDAEGVRIDNGAANNLIGGRSVVTNGKLGGAGNVITDNDYYGITIARGSSTGSNGNVIEGNFIGTDITGNAAVGNHCGGIRIVESSSNTVGGTTAGTGNVISGNLASESYPGDGITILGTSAAGTGPNPGATANVVTGNVIGLNFARTAALANQGNGVFIQGAAGNHIGGTFTPAAGLSDVSLGNIISGNAGSGVVVAGNTATGNSILNNILGGNGKLSIDLGNNGVTANDSLGHTGPNKYIDTPVFTVVVGAHGAGSLTDAGQAQGPNGVYAVQFYSSPTRQTGTLQAQGVHFVASAIVQIVANGFVNFPLPALVSGDKFILMTVTDSSGNTSEFSIASISGAHVDQGIHLTGGVTDVLKASKSVITTRETVTSTDILQVSPQSGPRAGAAQADQPRHSNGLQGINPRQPTGTVFFEDGDAVLGAVKVKVVKGGGQAQAQLRLLTVGVHTIYAVYQPDAHGSAQGFLPTYTSVTVTVTPSGQKGKPRDFVAGHRAVPSGPQGLSQNRLLARARLR